MGDSRLAYGQGGVVDLVSGRQLVAVDGEVTAVAETEDGIVYCIDRRLHRVTDGEFVGSANWLQPIEGVSPDDARRFLFVRNEVNGSLVGFMGSDLREVDANIWTVPIPGTTRHIRQEGDRFIVTSNLVVRIYRVNNDSLQLEDEIEIVGAQDAAMYGEDKVVLAGDFGRGLWRLEADRRGEKDSFAMYHPEPAGLRRAVSDGRNILADSDRGMWLYHIGDDVAQVSIEEVDFSKPSQRAVMLDWSFSIDDGGQTVSVETPVGIDRLVAPDGGRFYCVTSGDNAVWLSHDSGIIMVRLPKDGIVVPRGWDSMSEEDQRLSGVGPLDGMTKLSVRLDGPVFFLSPLMLGGGVAYVSETAGFGVVSEDF
jgi:hypothetical protein